MNDSHPLWETAVMMEAMHARPIGAMPATVSGLSIDSRTIAPGEAFFAIEGDRFDGHDFLTGASKAGAAVHIVAERKLPALGRVQSQTPMMVVDDVLKALGLLAEAARARSKARIVAVTGSVGKTTTKDALRHGLSAVGSVHASAASFNNHWGVPLSLARLPAETRFAVFEIGMNHPNEIRPLVKLVRPHVAIVTLIAAAHLGHFRDLDEITEAKAEIFEGLVAEGTAILNGDDPRCGPLATLARRAGTKTIDIFGETQGADFQLKSYEPSATGGVMEASIGGEMVRVELAAAGRHIAQNILAVLGTARVVGANVQAVAAALSGWDAVKGRGERHVLSIPKVGAITLIDESYNANPASMRAALAVLGSAGVGEGGHRVAVLGDMLELGVHGESEHGALAEPVLQSGAERVLLVGEEMRALQAGLDGRVACEWFADAQSLSRSLASHLGNGDVLLVKASKSIGLSPLVDGLVESYATQRQAEPAPAVADAQAACVPEPAPHEDGANEPTSGTDEPMTNEPMTNEPASKDSRDGDAR